MARLATVYHWPTTFESSPAFRKRYVLVENMWHATLCISMCHWTTCGSHDGFWRLLFQMHLLTLKIKIVVLLTEHSFILLTVLLPSFLWYLGACVIWLVTFHQSIHNSFNPSCVLNQAAFVCFELFLSEFHIFSPLEHCQISQHARLQSSDQNLSKGSAESLQGLHRDSERTFYNIKNITLQIY